MLLSQFTIPALLIQWECLVGGAGSAVIQACHWQTVNTEGRIIVVCNNQNNATDCKESIQLICKFLVRICYDILTLHVTIILLL